MEGEDLEQGAKLTTGQPRRIAPLYLQVTQQPQPEILHDTPPGSGDHRLRPQSALHSRDQFDSAGGAGRGPPIGSAM
jgi:hypothetical protein